MSTNGRKNCLKIKKSQTVFAQSGLLDITLEKEFAVNGLTNFADVVDFCSPLC